MDEQELEDRIQDKGLTRDPRLTPNDIDNQIIGEQYYRFPGTTTTVCCLTLRNGFSVIGESSCVSGGNFDEEIGQRVAESDARRKIWQLEGYLLKEKLNQ